jgi:hypothetical protein
LTLVEAIADWQERFELQDIEVHELSCAVVAYVDDGALALLPYISDGLARKTGLPDLRRAAELVVAQRLFAGPIAESPKAKPKRAKPRCSYCHEQGHNRFTCADRRGIYPKS